LSHGIQDLPPIHFPHDKTGVKATQRLGDQIKSRDFLWNISRKTFTRDLEQVVLAHQPPLSFLSLIQLQIQHQSQWVYQTAEPILLSHVSFYSPA
jgi:hypothetical protein